MIKYIVTFLNSNGLFDTFQTGFRKHHSTKSALIKLTDDISMGIEGKNITLLLQFHFSKTFWYYLTISSAAQTISIYLSMGMLVDQAELLGGSSVL